MCREGGGEEERGMGGSSGLGGRDAAAVHSGWKGMTWRAGTGQMASQIGSTRNVTLRGETDGQQGGEIDSRSAGEALGQLVTVLHVYGVRVSLWAGPRLAATQARVRRDHRKLSKSRCQVKCVYMARSLFCEYSGKERTAREGTRVGGPGSRNLGGHRRAWAQTGGARDASFKELETGQGMEGRERAERWGTGPGN